jgi:hypothetical protein
MAKERHRAQSEVPPRCKTDRINCQQCMVFVKKLPVKAAGAY